ncbi:MAG: hypothetical protein A3I07_02010 [Candidatus Doudnabacteria bacterium RIFCSPLOWO2_02_FULL_42_9]|uniref:Uncharacterized protein n=1 Tax=Candidatus Doudnabacteria bacterium RIFCSPHIGHO2_01_FULL_41_86 TaxID=1817821 RepID=A0A1F5N7N8_9BACT|nr:MAG: hypothetical protein A2717_03655 [Candidatus Doudnabacteria bacterium RIFCSPHIGHO2_01_FULL_41_86]OGE74770.1 MAG: hypothetical protein A3K07_03250 [Candidatus Doudnabacteria bacterium RIFCSPHIGHO2_01_43_10]OGE85737.1 MAG: hypothetical protein A3E28_02985 [Candidatus Doudnabacteria bacterium RIFCSPHIGHO2_12_FULL_42_22]OGE87233.1 MAG: hypothetical protein A3C49_00615 [Candidatus Doudnabacteria bacterium RIFCSPHIGHO2_02_FULL_42_25]OGE92070.1 MAG: hypothetical protein A2895_00490 [Candidatus
MKTDYQNLNWFETSLVAWGFVGVVVVGIVFFTGLTPQMQSDVAQAVTILDMNQQAQGVVDTVTFVWDAQNDFYEQFYLAFTEVATIPFEDFEPTIEAYSLAINHLTDQVRSGYEGQQQISYDTQGKVLGAIIEIGSIDTEPTYELELEMPYKFETPNINFLNNFAKVEAY